MKTDSGDAGTRPPQQTRIHRMNGRMFIGEIKKEVISMTKLTTRLFCVLMALMLCLSCTALAAEKQTELPLSTKGEKLVIYCDFNASQSSVYSDLSEHPVIKQMMDETGLTIEFMHPPVNDDGTFFNITIASGEWPDLFYTDRFHTTYPGGVEGAMDDGILVNVNELVPQYAPNFLQMVEEYDEGTGYIKNGIYGDNGAIVKLGSMFLAPYVNARVHYGPVVRADLLEKYGLEAPVTLDEYTNVLRTFKENGVEVPLALCNIFSQSGFYNSNFLSSAFGVTWNDFQVVDGKVVYSMMQPGYKEMVAFLNGWANEGLIDRDSVNRSLDDCLTVFQNGKAGMTVYHNSNTTTALKVGQTIDPDYEIVGLLFPRKAAEDQLTLARIVYSLNNWSWQISQSCENPELAVKFIDYLHDDDTRLLTAWGPGSEEFPTFVEDENGMRTFTDFMYENPKYDFTTARQLYTLNTFQVQYDDMMERQQYYLPQQLANWESWVTRNSDADKIPSLVTMNVDESREYSDIMSKVNNYVEEQVYAFIFGQASMDDYDAFVKQIENLGIARACEIKQAAYDRYIARSAK